MTKEKMDRILKTGGDFLAALNEAGADLDVTVTKQEKMPYRDHIGCVIIGPLFYELELRSTTVTRIE